MEEYWDELLTIAITIVLGAMSPGPDCAVVTKHSLCSSRKAGLFAALGISAGITVHMTYILFGVGLIISQSPLLFSIIKYAGSAYLLYLGYKTLFTESGAVDLSPDSNYKPVTPYQAFKSSFITCSLNPHCTLFFLSLFSFVLDRGTPYWVQCIYALTAIVLTGLWFAVLALVLSGEDLQKRLQGYQQMIHKCLGCVLLFLGVYIGSQ